MEGLYEREGSSPLQHLQNALTDEKKKAGAHASGDSLTGVVWTPSMRRMYTLLDRCAIPYPTPPPSLRGGALFPDSLPPSSQSQEGLVGPLRTHQNIKSLLIAAHSPHSTA